MYFYMLMIWKIEVYFELGCDCDNIILICLVNLIGCKSLRDEIK